MAAHYSMGEFFSGPGGLSLGASMAAESFNEHVVPANSNTDPIVLEHQWAVDIDSDSCETYRNNILAHRPQAVRNIDAREAIKDLDSFEPIDGFAFGFPCNDFSLVGKQKGLLGDFGGLYQAGVAVLNKKEPKWFVAENVGGVRSANQGDAFKQILADLQAAKGKSYDIVPHLYRFEEYGVPQTRHRVIIVGIHKDEQVRFKVPAPSHGPRNNALNLPRYVSAETALSATYPAGLNVKHTEDPVHTERVRQRLTYIPEGGNAFSAAMPENLKLNVKGATLSHIYRRLRREEPSYTITGSGGGGTHVYHWEENRALTNRERARLQTFPDDFNFSGSRSSVRKQIGMAVPPLGAKTIFEALFKTLNGITYDTTEPNLLEVLRESKGILPSWSQIRTQLFN
ncbi:DNA cytosine methyltransferase [Brevibacterium sp. HMSC22B09]|uniref:DNA cytosine methyltransferase n=1 Tax=Brevibacterium sp. HMSC22B09 TaxID=1581055 RepID=UPI000B2B9363|nr:DNA (cytosine-5-)-methyltransferase [Brevibacterium sp. HMSC22B09]